MIRLVTNLDASSLESELNSLGPSIEVLSIYAINLRHFAWVRILDLPKAEKRGKK
jgi:hypothetical protein